MVQVDKRSHLVLFKQNQRNHYPYTSELQKAYKTDYLANRHNMMGTVSKLYVSNNTWIYVYIKNYKISTPIPTPESFNSNSNSNSGSFNSNSNSNSGKSLEYQLQLQLQLQEFQLQLQLQPRPISRISTPTPTPTPEVSTPIPTPTPELELELNPTPTPTPELTPTLTGEFPLQMASNAENVSIWWHHHDVTFLPVDAFKTGNCTSRKRLIVMIPTLSSLRYIANCRNDNLHCRQWRQSWHYEGWNNLSISKLQHLHCWSLGMDM